MAIKGAIKNSVVRSAVGILTDWEQPNAGGGGGGEDGRDETIFDLTTITAAAASVSSSVNTTQASMYQVFMKPDGTKVFVSGSGASKVSAWPLPTPYDVSTLGTLQETGTLDAVGDGRGMWISPDGVYLFFGTDLVTRRYEMSTPWDPSTAGSAQQSLDMSNELTSDFQTICFNYTGTRFFVTELGAVDTIFQYNLSTPWDLETAVYSKSLDLATLTGEGGIRGAVLAENGRQLFAIGGSGQINEVLLPTIDDLGSATLGDQEAYTMTGSGHVPMGLSLTHVLIGSGITTDLLQTHAWGPHS